jgi:hypothetical protein
VVHSQQVDLGAGERKVVDPGELVADESLASRICPVVESLRRGEQQLELACGRLQLIARMKPGRMTKPFSRHVCAASLRSIKSESLRSALAATQFPGVPRGASTTGQSQPSWLTARADVACVPTALRGPTQPTVWQGAEREGSASQERVLVPRCAFGRVVLDVDCLRDVADPGGSEKPRSRDGAAEFRAATQDTGYTNRSWSCWAPGRTGLTRRIALANRAVGLCGSELMSGVRFGVGGCGVVGGGGRASRGA